MPGQRKPASLEKHHRVVAFASFFVAACFWIALVCNRERASVWALGGGFCMVMACVHLVLARRAAARAGHGRSGPSGVAR